MIKSQIESTTPKNNSAISPFKTTVEPETKPTYQDEQKMHLEMRKPLIEDKTMMVPHPIKERLDFFAVFYENSA